jgi:hypothetical protein
MNLSNRSTGVSRRHAAPRPVRNPSHTVSRDHRPVAAFRQRGWQSGLKLEDFNAPETWHEPGRGANVRYVVQPPRTGFRHAASADDVRERLARLPKAFTRQLDVVQMSAMTRKRQLFPCYGMQWGSAVYLYPIEDSLVEEYHRPPTPQQRIEAGMYGGEWSQEGNVWKLTWTDDTIKDFYLNNVLIHEVGHLNDTRNTNSRDRERFANWFAIEYGYRATR